MNKRHEMKWKKKQIEINWSNITKTAYALNHSLLFGLILLLEKRAMDSNVCNENSQPKCKWNFRLVYFTLVHIENFNT